MTEQNKQNEGKPTPGPWKASEAICRNAPNAHVVTDGKWGSPNIAVVDTEANARLIAAAPDLLEACEKVYANAAENPEWIRMILGPAIAKARRGK